MGQEDASAALISVLFYASSPCSRYPIDIFWLLEVGYYVENKLGFEKLVAVSTTCDICHLPAIWSKNDTFYHLVVFLTYADCTCYRYVLTSYRRMFNATLLLRCSPLPEVLQGGK